MRRLAIPQRLGPPDQCGAVARRRLQDVVPLDVAVEPERERFRDQVDADELPPWRVGLARGHQRLASLSLEPNVVGAVVVELDVDRCAPHFAVVEPDERSGRVAGDRDRPLHAPRKERRGRPEDRQEPHGSILTTAAPFPAAVYKEARRISGRRAYHPWRALRPSSISPGP